MSSKKGGNGAGSPAYRRKQAGGAGQGWVRVEPDAVGRVLATLALDETPERQQMLEDLSRQRREVAELFVAESLRRARERRERIAAEAAEAAAHAA